MLKNVIKLVTGHLPAASLVICLRRHWSLGHLPSALLVIGYFDFVCDLFFLLFGI